jgi:tetratricopeptide (TPR) repeat protein
MAQRTLRDFLQETEDAISSGRADAALAHCQSILASFPESLEAQRLLGEVYLAQGRLEEALHSFDWVLTNDPENVIAYCNRALVSERMSDYDTALDCYQQAYELSRGNSQIRQEFNQLSAKAGQQGFMFSRAGLARLYMRGDLLSQAMQEWDAVLATAPDRLDARTGLLETCWREGMLDRVEQLAMRILQDVPNCVKALLLLAHVTAPRDMTRARDLLQRAEAFDPDLVMAQELFADLLTSQPDNPFLKQLRKSSAIVEAAGDTPKTETPSSEDLKPSPSPQPAMSSLDALSQWGNIEGWSNDTTLVKPKATENSNVEEQKSALASWPLNDAGSSVAGIGTGSSVPGLEPVDRSSSDMISISSWNIQSPSQPMPSLTGEPEPWQLLQEALSDMPSSSSDEPSVWGGNEPSPSDVAVSGSSNSDHWTMPSDSQASEPSSTSSWDLLEASTGNKGRESASSPSWEMPAGEKSDQPISSPSWEMPAGENASEAVPSSTWEAPAAPDEKASAPPAWLNMLTQTDRRQMTADMPAIRPGARASSEESQKLPEAAVSEPAMAEPMVVPSPIAQSPAEPEKAEAVEEEKFPFAMAGEEDGDEALPFGPAWLKSLGATVLDDEKQPSIAMPRLQSSTSVEPEQPVALESAKSAEQIPSPAPVTSEIPAQTHPEQAAPIDPWQVSSLVSSSPEVNEAPAAYASWQQTPPVEVNEEPAAYASWQQRSIPEANDAPAVVDPTESGYYSSWQAAQSGSHEPAATSGDSLSDLWKMAQPGPEAEQEPVQSAPATFEAWQSFEQTREPEENVESNLLSTLEELELQLRSKGFIPLEPKSLASIAQVETQGNAGEIQHSQEAQVEPTREIQPESSRSSALAELGNMAQRMGGDVQAPEPISSEPEVANTSEEPLWLRELRSTPSTPAAAPAAQQDLWPAANRSVEAEPFWGTSPAPQPASQVPMPPVNVPPTYVEQLPGIVFESTPPPATWERRISSEPPKTPVARNNPFLDSELETTMKRPAVRLQSMPQRSVSGRDVRSGNGLISKARQAPTPPPPTPLERKEPAIGSKPVDTGNSPVSTGPLSYKDRLLKGYQHQLVGDYDEAMQEYRIIIRSAPELLGEVVSNVRALLKIAPRYSAGYRVLGDAYMRQGEYLQAMDSYNKALTMAKKGKN